MSQIENESKNLNIKEVDIEFCDIKPEVDDIKMLSKEFNSNNLTGYLRDMSYTWMIEPYKELLGQRHKVLVKKVLRKCMYFFVNPIVHEQNNFNALTVKSLGQLESFIRKQMSENEYLKNRIRALEEKLRKKDER